MAVLVAGSVSCKDGKRDRAAHSAAEDRAQAAPAPREAEPARARAAARPERVVVTQVALRVEAPPEGPAREIYTREFGQDLGRQLSESPLFASTAAEVPDGHRAREATVDVRIGHDVVAGPEGGRVLVAAIEGRVLWDDPAQGDLAPSAAILAERPIDAGERANEDGLLATLVATTVAQVGHDLVAKEQVRTGGTEALVDALESADGDMVLWALELIAERARGDLLDRVVAALASEQVLVRNQALTTLVALGDPRAVDALARRAPFDDHEFMRMVIEAVTALGGDDARQYLEFIASGHPDDDLRARARDGLDRLDRAGAR